MLIIWVLYVFYWVVNGFGGCRLFVLVCKVGFMFVECGLF